jgi:hypothetical protein
VRGSNGAEDEEAQVHRQYHAPHMAPACASAGGGAILAEGWVEKRLGAGATWEEEAQSIKQHPALQLAGLRF